VIVISDNSALSALAEAGLLDLLPRMFGLIVLPESVRLECAHSRAPEPLRDWICLPPDWIEIVADPADLLTETQGLGSGEAAAITLAWVNRKSSLLILDEKRGRRVAEALGLPKTGVLGIVGEAADRGWLGFDETIEKIARTGFHLSDSVVEAARRKIQL
jgi:predicted nucleic acid-binding protein